MIIHDLIDSGKINPPLNIRNLIYATRMGSQAYGVANENSDNDIYCVYLPIISDVIPDKNQFIHGFGKKFDPLQSWQAHHIEYNDQSYDVSFYSAQKYFDLCMNCNPNMIDSLFTDESDCLYMTDKGRLLKSNRHLFLSKQIYHKFRGFSFSERYKWEKDKSDLKRAYHMIRMLFECKEFISYSDIDLKRTQIYLRMIRDGNVLHEDISSKFDRMIIDIEDMYKTTKLPDEPRYDEIFSLLKDIVFN